jgi:hypothetical protein
MGVLIVSHCTWDVWIFLVQPTGETTAVAGRDDAAVAAARAAAAGW